MKNLLLLCLCIFWINFAFTQDGTTEIDQLTLKGIEETKVIPNLGYAGVRDVLMEQNLHAFLMPPRDRGNGGNSTFYALASALEFYVNLNGNYKHNLSPDYIDLSIEKNDQKDDFFNALNFLKEQGTVSAAFLPYTSNILRPSLYNADKFKIANHVWICHPELPERSKIFALRKSLVRGNPIVLNIAVDENFDQLGSNDSFWHPKRDKKTITTVLVVGFNEGKKAFEVMNSRGAHWGNRGCIWIKYEDLAKVAKDGVVLVPFEEELKP